VLENSAICARSVSKENLRCASQNSKLEVHDAAVINGVFGKWRSRQIGVFENARLTQALKAEQQVVSGKGGEALIRRVCIAGRIQRQDLPQLLPGGRKKVGEFVGTWAQIAYAETAGQ
jgi:hypothetical protein